MSNRTLVAVFAQERDLVCAVGTVRKAGLTIGDVYTPYAVHGLDRALGWRPSRLGWACAAGGLFGSIFMLWFQWWTSAVSWPLNVGGKPWNSLPAFVPITFEGMVLCAGLGSVFALFLVARLYPGKQATPIIPDVFNDRFVMLVNETDATFDARAVANLLRKCHAIEVTERILEDDAAHALEARRASRARWRTRLNYGLLLILVVMIAVNLIAIPNPQLPNWEFLPDMAHSPAFRSESANPNFADGKTLQRPVAGTVAQGELPLHFAATDAEALRAGEELHNPLSANDAGIAERGAHVFQVSCLPCHGAGGQGDGAVTRRGYPAPPSLVTGNTTKMPDGQLFHIISYGRGNMPPQAGLLSLRDRWAVIVHIRSLQGAAAPSALSDKP